MAVKRVCVRGVVYRLRMNCDADAGGFAVQCVELPGAIEQGETLGEAIANGKAAVESVLTFRANRK
ncbi:MAG: type II toxin-antitoxin system HicB family antitoxin [Planctomycetes bacterium]|nr:type II toxin-antitoxin system HicB family antitoxin [Planctomycetota bacterium]